MKVVSFQTDSGSPNSAAWHAWRAQGIGGSEAAPIAFDAGLIPEKASWMPNLEQLYGRKIGMVPPQELNGAMQRGTNGEVPAREKYEDITGNLVSPCFGEMDGREYIRASLDGLDFGGDLLVEIKCAGQKVHELAEMGGIVGYYQPQVTHQACVAWGEPGVTWQGKMIHFFNYIPETGQYALVEKKASDFEAMAEKLLEAEERFWACVRARVLPCGDEWAVAAAIYRHNAARLDAAKAAEEKAREGLVKLLGNATRRDGAGVAVVRGVRKGNVDYSELLKAKGITLAPAEVNLFRKSSSDTLTVRVIEALPE